MASDENRRLFTIIVLKIIIYLFLQQFAEAKSVPATTIESEMVFGSSSSSSASEPGLKSFDTLQNLPIAQLQLVTRQNDGDLFTLESSECNVDTCIGFSSGTATLYKSTNDNFKNTCICQCLQHLSTFRDDLHICVDDIHECTLAPFVSGSITHHIPFVILPLKGQIIHPSKEVNLNGLKSPACSVHSAQFLSSNGWLNFQDSLIFQSVNEGNGAASDGANENVRNHKMPFQMFRDEGRTFLQWLGENDLRSKMSGRVILVRLVCKDLAVSVSETMQSNESSNIVVTCVAFRIVGSPSRYLSNVTEVVFSADLANRSSLNIFEYLAIVLCTLILGLIYVTTVFLYLYLKRRHHHHQNSNGSVKSNFHGNESLVTAAVSSSATHNRNDLRFYKSLRTNLLAGRSGSGSTGVAGSEYFTQAANQQKPPQPHHHHHHKSKLVTAAICDSVSSAAAFENHISEEDRESDDDTGAYSNKTSPKHVKTAAFVHSEHQLTCTSNSQLQSGSITSSSAKSYETSNECLPEENLAIIESFEEQEERESFTSETTNSLMQNVSSTATMRQKLYFNPAYFEPHLLLTPPPAAIEFVTKIREVINMARQKITAKRFVPSLNEIPEENYGTTEALTNATASATTTATTTYTAIRKKSLGQLTAPLAAAAGASSGSSSSSSSLSNVTYHQLKTASAKKTDTASIVDKRDNIKKWLENIPVRFERTGEISGNGGGNSNSGGCCDTESGDSLENLKETAGELTVQNAVISSFIKPADNQLSEILAENCKSASGNYHLVSEVYVNNGFSDDINSDDNRSTLSSIDTLKKEADEGVRHDGDHGRESSTSELAYLKIEIEDCPDHYRRTFDTYESDNFEPDTLEKKPHFHSSISIDFNNNSNSQSDEYMDSLERPLSNRNDGGGGFSRKTTGSLREIYEARRLRAIVAAPADPATTDFCRVLSLEERHSKRQRKSTLDQRRKMEIYARPKTTRELIVERISSLPRPKNVCSGSTYPLSGGNGNVSGGGSGASTNGLVTSRKSSCLHLMGTSAKPQKFQSLSLDTLKRIVSRGSSNSSGGSGVGGGGSCCSNGGGCSSGDGCHGDFDDCYDDPDENRESLKRDRKRSTPKYEDSGYLSTDSNEDFTNRDAITLNRIRSEPEIKSYSPTTNSTLTTPTTSSSSPISLHSSNSNHNHRQKITNKRQLSNLMCHYGLETIAVHNATGTATDGAISETDESFGDGHSESGAESIETHSVFFNSFRNSRKLSIPPTPTSPAPFTKNEYFARNSLTTMRKLKD